VRLVHCLRPFPMHPLVLGVRKHCLRMCMGSVPGILVLPAAGLAWGAITLLCVPNPQHSARAPSQDDGYTHYDAATLEEGKRQCKMALQRELGLPVNADVPMLGFIGRLDYQKVGRQWGRGWKSNTPVPRAPVCESDRGSRQGLSARLTVLSSNGPRSCASCYLWHRQGALHAVGMNT